MDINYLFEHRPTIAERGVTERLSEREYDRIIRKEFKAPERDALQVVENWWED